MPGPTLDATESPVPSAEPTSRTHALRRRWKPQKERLIALRKDHPTTIRFHRACSWLQRAEETDPADIDLRLVSLWIGFNALYGTWNADSRQPAQDRQSWQEFLDRLLRLDHSGHLASILQDHKPTVMAIFEDQYLSTWFWEEPGPQRAGRSRKVKFDAQTWYLEGRWGLILLRLMERIYFLRCQLVHGAATHGSRVNRQPLARCTTLLAEILVAILQTLADHGADEDWGLMCYPPLGSPS